MAADMVVVERNSAGVYVWVAISQYWLSMPLQRSSIVRRHNSPVSKRERVNSQIAGQVHVPTTSTRAQMFEKAWHYASLQQACRSTKAGRQLCLRI
jgi:hypothetical protein